MAAVFFVALALRIAALVATRPTGPAGDELELFVRAARMVTGPPIADDTARAPGILYFYASAFHALWPALIVAKAANVLVSSLTVWPAYWIGRQFGGVRQTDAARGAEPIPDREGVQVGLLAAAGVALYPTFIAFSHFVWSEPLFILLSSSGVALLVRARGGDRLLDYALAGSMLGLAALTKESGVLFVPLAAIYLYLLDRAQPRRAALRALSLSFAFGLVLLPWTLHINEPGQPFALVTRTGYMNLFVGNHPRGAGQGMREYPELAPTRLEAEEVARDRALAEIRSRGPAWPLEKLVSEVPRFFAPTSFAVRRLLSEPGAEGSWGYRFAFELGNRRGPRIAAVVVVVASYMAVALAGVAGLALARRRDLAGLFLVFVASQLAPSIVMFSMSRFRLPSMFFLIIAAASLGVSGRRDFAAASPRRRAWALGSTLAMGLLIAVGYESVLRPTGG
jgi:4-amino-4-deoxy-L-arabinose transferase-like glycosyltransferase